jgi:hypothetical protein
MGLTNHGVKPDTQTHVGSLGVLRFSSMPAILVELAFIDSPLHNPDVAILRDRRPDMARALADGVFKFLCISVSEMQVIQKRTVDRTIAAFDAIKAAIECMLVDVGDIPVEEYADKIRRIHFDAGMLPPFAEATWADVMKAGNMIPRWDAAEVPLRTGWNIGDTVERDGFIYRIAGFNHDDRADGRGKAGITLELTSVMLNAVMESAVTNANSWRNSRMRLETMAGIFEQLPEELRQWAVPVIKRTAAGNRSADIIETHDTVWLFSVIELIGGDYHSGAGEGEQYEWHKINSEPSNRIKYREREISQAGTFSHTVQSGESLWILASRFNVSMNEIRQLNGLTSDELTIGQVLLIPTTVTVTETVVNSWWTRTPYINNGTDFVNIGINGSPRIVTANVSTGVSFGVCF